MDDITNQVCASLEAMAEQVARTVFTVGRVHRSLVTRLFLATFSTEIEMREDQEQMESMGNEGCPHG